MLPDLRIVIAAVVSTFIVTVGVGFYASSRLIQEQMTARFDTKGFDDTPVNRIALNWPEPTSQERRLDLDFAVSLKASRNPVREIGPANDDVSAGLPPQPAATTPSPAPAGETAAPIPIADDPAQSGSSPVAEPRQENDRSSGHAAAQVPAVSDDATPAREESEAPASIAPEPQQHIPQRTEPLPPEQQQLALLHREERVDAAPPPVAADLPGQPAAPQPETAHIAAAPAAPEDARDSRPDVTGSVAAMQEAPAIPLPEPRPRIAAHTATEDAGPAAQPATGATAPAARKKRPRKSVKQTAAIRSPSAQALQPFDFFGLFRVQPLTLREKPRSDTTPP